MLAPSLRPSHDPLAIAADRLRAGQRVRDGIAAPSFASPEHREFYESQAPELLGSGWMGVGKSRLLCEKAWHLALEYPGSELALFRKVHKSLASTTERTFWQEVADPRYVVARNQTDNWVDLSAGGRPSRIWFLGLDQDPKTGQPTKVGSLNLDWAGVDEAIQLDESDWILLGGRLRRTSMPYRQLAAITNPASPKHWLKVHFTPSTEARQFIVLRENRFLTEDYIERLGTMGEGYHARRLAKGEWVAAEGTIWLLPDEQIAKVEPREWKRVVAGIDWGFVHAFACEVVAESGSGTRATIAEVYTNGRLLDDIIPELLELQTRLKIESFYGDPSEPENIERCRRKGLRIEAAINDVLPGIDAVAASIKKGEIVDSSCTGLLGELPEYTWQRDRASGEAKEKPIELHDDACDAWRYAHMALDVGGGFGDYYRDALAQMRADKAAAA